jgi:tRNA pseudouridine55 synthase
MIIPIYKKKGPTSRDIVNTLKKEIGEKKIGHGGTLDPLAEGVLVVGIGRTSTKKLHTEMFNEKEYLATIFLGEKSTTGDREGEKTKIEFQKKLKVKEIEKVLESFVGTILQRPPAFSAVKIEGKESYKWARKGIIKETKKREVELKKIDLLSFRYPFLKIKVTTGKGVYIRSLAEDIGENLRCGGYLYSLVRTRVGSLKLEDCYDDIEIRNLYDRIKKN